MAGGMLRTAQTPLEVDCGVGCSSLHCTDYNACTARTACTVEGLAEGGERMNGLAYRPWVFPGSEQSQGEYSVVPDGRVWQCRWRWVTGR